MSEKIQKPAIEWEELTLKQRAALKIVCENDFLAFHRAFFGMTQGEVWGVNWHHRYLAKTIEDMILGKMPGESLIINVPPGAGKTEVFSIHAPVWATIKVAKLRNLNISFSDSLVKKNSRRSKDVIKSDPFQAMWPCSFGTDKDNEWNIINDKNKPIAEIVSRSMGGQITGGRGGYIMPGFSGSVTLDDPDKPEDMFSKVKRNRSQRIIVDTLRSRRAMKTIENPTPFIVVQQRLHVSDTTGFLLGGGLGKAMKYKHVKIPALINQEYIDALPEWIRQECIDSVCHTKQINGYWSFWPSNESVDDLISLWESNEYTFMSQYLQRPIKLGGSLFKSEWWQFYGEIQTETDEDGNVTKSGLGPDLPVPPSYEYRFITADTASKTKEVNDYTVLCEWGYWDGKIYLLSMKRGKWEAPDLRKTFIKFVGDAYSKNGVKHGRLRNAYVEDKASGTSLIQDMKSEISVSIVAVQRNTDKLVRAMNVTSKVYDGLVVLPYGAQWVTEFVAEHSEFSIDDTHENDDMVDNTIDAIEVALMSQSTSKTSLMAGFYKKKRGQ